MLRNSIIFNFAASCSGGGYKRLLEYVKAFDKLGGALFIVNSKCGHLAKRYRNNEYYIVNQSLLDRLFRDCYYLSDVVSQCGRFDTYYSYGIPIYSRIAKCNWFHLSNVLPLSYTRIPMGFSDNIKMRWLGHLIKSNLHNADIVSAESQTSLDLFRTKFSGKLFLSVNGVDDELSRYARCDSLKQTPTAVVVGTYRYKALDDSYRAFQMLKDRFDNTLNLVIIGDPSNVPRYMTRDDSVRISGYLPREEVYSSLSTSKYYISTTLIENSSNATLEGVFISRESFISDIGPHRELINNCPYELVQVPNLTRKLLHLRRDDISKIYTKSWPEVVEDVLVGIRGML